MDNKIDFVLEDIRRACELGDVEEVLKLSEQLKKLNNADTITIERDKYDNITVTKTDECGEIIVDRYGKDKEVPRFTGPNFGNYRGITALQIAENSKHFAEQMQKISKANSEFLKNIKPAN